MRYDQAPRLEGCAVTYYGKRPSLGIGSTADEYDMVQGTMSATFGRWGASVPARLRRKARGISVTAF